MAYPPPRKFPFYFRDGGRTPSLFYGFHDFQTLSQQITPIVKDIARQKRIRHVVLDSWCLLDFLVRRNLVLLLGISKFEAHGFDPKFDLLPRSFEELLKCFESFRASQMQLPSDIDPFDKAARIPWPVIKTLFKDKELGERFEAILNEYYAKENPAMLGALILAERHPKNLTGANRTFIQKLDKRWFRQARQLNKARNLAAHSMNDTKVASAFGISGKNPVLQVRRKCLTLLASLAGIKKPA